METVKFEIKRKDITLKGNAKKNPQAKAKFIIVHGMAEHALRYEDFAEALFKAGFSVYFFDQRGHGATAGSVDKQGFFAEKEGWQVVRDDLNAVVDYVIADSNKLPIFMLGHSMGSFIARNFTSEYGEKLAGLILSGTAGSAGLLASAGLLVTRIIMLFNKKTTPSPLLDKLSFGDFNKKFKPNRTASDWLSRDNAQVDKYINDPYCGAIFSVGFFNDLIGGLELVNKPTNAAKFPKDLPLYLYSGANDPVSKGAKQIPKVVELYKNAGVTDISVKIYPDGRHEMLNEINKTEVYQDIINWVNSKL